MFKSRQGFVVYALVLTYLACISRLSIFASKLTYIRYLNNHLIINSSKSSEAYVFV